MDITLFNIYLGTAFIIISKSALSLGNIHNIANNQKKHKYYLILIRFDKIPSRKTNKEKQTTQGKKIFL